MGPKPGYCSFFAITRDVDSSQGGNPVYQGDGSRSPFSYCVVSAAAYLAFGTERVVKTQRKR